MSALDQLFKNNKVWAQSQTKADPEFFRRLASQQNPKYLWIGCSDSRVPGNVIVGLDPGELFVHRNVANVVVHSDLNCLSVLQFAVDVLKVEHIILCGHYGCGGVRAALDDARLGLIDNWLRHVQDVRDLHSDELEALPTDEAKFRRLCELNVIEQVTNLAKTTIIQDAWARGQSATIHGVIYGISDGILKSLDIATAAPAV